MVISPRHYFNQARRIARHGFISLEQRPYALASLSGILFLLCAYVPGCWFLIFFALVPFVHAVRTAQSLTKVCGVGALFGSLLLGGSTFATLSAGLASGIGALDPSLERALVFLSWMIFFVPLVPTVVAFAVVLRVVPKISFGLAVPLALVWVFLEYVRMVMFNMATYAPHINNPPFFSAGSLGYVLADSESFLQLASLGGLPLLSVVVVVVNIILYRGLVTKERGRVQTLATILIVISVATFVPVAQMRAVVDANKNWKPVSVGVMSVYPRNVHDYYASIAQSLRELTSKSPDLVVLPEGASYQHHEVRELREDDVEESTRVLSSRFTNIGGLTAHVAEVSVTGGQNGRVVRGKSVLAAQGEYIIGIFAFIAKQLGLSGELNRFRSYGTLSAMEWGTGFSVGTTGVRVSVGFCVEMLRPYLGTMLVKRENTGLIAFMLAHDQFNDAYTLRIDTLRFLRVRAVEAGVPLVASARATPAYVLDAYGRVIRSFGHHGDAWGVVTLEALSTEPAVK